MYPETLLPPLLEALFKCFLLTIKLVGAPGENLNMTVYKNEYCYHMCESQGKFSLPLHASTLKKVEKKKNHMTYLISLYQDLKLVPREVHLATCSRSGTCGMFWVLCWGPWVLSDLSLCSGLHRTQ